MKRSFKTKEEAVKLFRHFYDEAFDDERTNIAILNPDDNDTEWYYQKLKVQKCGESYYRVYSWRREINKNNDTPYDYNVYFYIETLDGQKIEDQNDVSEMQNYFNVFKYYDITTS